MANGSTAGGLWPFLRLCPFFPCSTWRFIFIIMAIFTDHSAWSVNPPNDRTTHRSIRKMPKERAKRRGNKKKNSAFSGGTKGKKVCGSMKSLLKRNNVRHRTLCAKWPSLTLVPCEHQVSFSFMLQFSSDRDGHSASLMAV